MGGKGLPRNEIMGQIAADKEKKGWAGWAALLQEHAMLLLESSLRLPQGHKESVKCLTGYDCNQPQK